LVLHHGVYLSGGNTVRSIPAQPGNETLPWAKVMEKHALDLGLQTRSSHHEMSIWSKMNSSKQSPRNEHLVKDELVKPLISSLLDGDLKSSRSSASFPCCL